MIGNFSFEEHVKYFNGMYNHLRSIDRSLDDATIINVIKSKVMIEQERENMHNLNIKNIFDTPMIKDFKIWSSKYNLNSEDEEESEEESEVQSNEDESEAQNGEDKNDYGEAAPSGYSAVEEFRRNYRSSEALSMALSRVQSDNDLPEDY